MIPVGRRRIIESIAHGTDPSMQRRSLWQNNLPGTGDGFAEICRGDDVNNSLQPEHYPPLKRLEGRRNRPGRTLGAADSVTATKVEVSLG